MGTADMTFSDLWKDSTGYEPTEAELRKAGVVKPLSPLEAQGIEPRPSPCKGDVLPLDYASFVVIRTQRILTYPFQKYKYTSKR